MSDKDSTDFSSDEARAQLNDGLKTCRTVVENYRLMLGDAVSAEAVDDDKQPVLPPTADNSA